MSHERFTPSARHRLPLKAKAELARLSRPLALWRCCGCGVKVLAKDQVGHAAREHGGNTRWEMVR